MSNEFMELVKNSMAPIRGGDGSIPCSVLRRLRNDLSVAIKERDIPKKDILKVVIADIERINPAQLNDDKANAIIAKTYEGLVQLAEFMAKNNDLRLNSAKVEMGILHGYLPKMLSRNEIKAELEKIRDSFVGVPDAQCMRISMEHFKKLGMKVDGRLVKELIDEVRR